MEPATTQRIIRDFFGYRSRGKFALAAPLLAADFSFSSPMMHFESAAEYIASHVSFHDIVVRYELISELYGDGEAALLYDLLTATPVGTQRTAEHFRLIGGKIASIVLIFDASPWRPIIDAPAQDKPEGGLEY